MKNALKVSTILSWVNLIAWGLFAGNGILESLFGGNPLLLLFAFLFSAIVLHSYACLKLQKSIKNPAIPLNSQTSVGIRFIGLIALLFGIGFFTLGFVALQNIRTIAPLMAPQMPPEYKGVDLYHFVTGFGIFLMISGILIAVNVFLSFRLLRWYLFLRENDIK
ncbi:MAG TPA: hypothetical protein VNS58_03820 [Puia sp.]|nr:hypothetical protein [Puia sp.]